MVLRVPFQQARPTLQSPGNSQRCASCGSSSSRQRSFLAGATVREPQVSRAWSARQMWYNEGALANRRDNTGPSSVELPGMRDQDRTDMGGSREEFLTTQWSLIDDIKAGADTDRALIGLLLERYWKP